MKQKSLPKIAILFCLQILAIQFLVAQPIGYASLNVMGQNGTTGGAGGPVVTVTNSSDLLDYISRTGSYVIQISGMISVPGGMHDITSNKTVIGLGSNSGIRGGGFNVGLPIDNGPTSPPANAVYNVIIRNLVFEDANDDNLNVMMFSHHVWIDHNTFLSTYDGACDVKRGSNYVTVSYNHFKNINKTCLLGHDDGNGDQDRGRLKVTYHHNFFDNCNQRQPRVRFGEPHIFNNYWLNPGSYCIGRGVEASVYSENNHKDGGNSFSKDYGGGAVLDVGSIGGSSTGSVNWNPADRYSYTADPASSVKSTVMANAGVGKIDPTGPTTPPQDTPEPTPEPTPIVTQPPQTGLLGDVDSDGEITIVDALLVAQYYVNLVPVVFVAANADVDCSGIIDIVDALLIAQYYVNLINSFPGCGTDPTPTPLTGTETYELQAEDASWSSGSVDSEHSGYTGSGYVNTDNSSGEWIEWSINLAAAGSASCVFTYACESGDRPVNLTVNGSNAGSLTFPASGAWNSWSTESTSVNLNAGTNTIRLTATGSGGAANMDKLDLTTGGVITDPTPAPNETPGPTVTPDPNTTGDPAADEQPHGYARNTTGGGNASPQTVTSASAFKSAVDGSDSAVIIVNGMLNTGDVDIGSNKTIIGANGNSGLTGGTVRVRSNNVIFKNLIIADASDDAMEISGASNIFIHKCTFVDGGDGSCDIVRASDNVTLSWCRFYYNDTHDHRFPILIGNSDSATGDRGKLHVTIHHTWFDNGCIERLPRVRFGYVHLYNNYYSSNTVNYCIGLGIECHVQVENSYFEDQSQLWYDWGGSSSGILGWNNLHVTGSSTIPTWMPNSFPALSLPYSYNLSPAEDTKSIVMSGAGSS